MVSSPGSFVSKLYPPAATPLIFELRVCTLYLSSSKYEFSPSVVFLSFSDFLPSVSLSQLYFNSCLPCPLRESFSSYTSLCYEWSSFPSSFLISSLSLTLVKMSPLSFPLSSSLFFSLSIFAHPVRLVYNFVLLIVCCSVYLSFNSAHF